MYSDSTDVHISLVLSLYGEFTFYMRLSCLWTVSPSSVSGHAVPASEAGRGRVHGGQTVPRPAQHPAPRPAVSQGQALPGLSWSRLGPAASRHILHILFLYTAASPRPRQQPAAHTLATDRFPFIRYRIVPGAWSLDKQGPQTSIIWIPEN